MSKVFVAEFRRTINLGFIIAIIGVIFSICFDSWNDLVGNLGHSNLCAYYFMENSSFGGMCRKYLLPIFATLPFACSFCKERKNKVVAFIASREGRRKYSVIKYLVNALVGGLVVALGTAFLFLFLLSNFPMIDSNYEVTQVSEAFHIWLAINHPVKYCLLEVVFAFCRGAIWASVSMLVSIYITDSFVVTLFPFLGNYMVVRLCQFLKIADTHRLDMILISRSVIKNSEYTLVLGVIATIMIVGVIGFIFTKKMVRGLKDGTLY